MGSKKIVDRTRGRRGTKTEKSQSKSKNKSKSNTSNGTHNDNNEDEPEVLIVPSSSSDSQNKDQEEDDVVQVDEDEDNDDDDEEEAKSSDITSKRSNKSKDDNDGEEKEVVNNKKIKNKNNKKNEDALYCFPMNRVGRIIKSEDSDIHINQEAIFLINKASEKFLELFCKEAYACSVLDRRTSLGYKHLSSVVCKRRRFDFLSDFIPEKVKAEDALAELPSAET